MLEQAVKTSCLDELHRGESGHRLPSKQLSIYLSVVICGIVVQFQRTILRDWFRVNVHQPYVDKLSLKQLSQATHLKPQQVQSFLSNERFVVDILLTLHVFHFLFLVMIGL